MNVKSEATASTDGGCLCGAIRYAIHGVPGSSGICHCQSCRRAAGSPAVAWITLPVDRFSFARGTPAQFRSSPPVVRTFCATCGTPLTYVHAEDADKIDVTTCSLDDPEAFPPSRHSFYEERLSWDRFVDDHHRPGG